MRIHHNCTAALATAVQARQQEQMGRIGQAARVIGDGAAPLLDLVYPPRCPTCGDALGEQGGLCAECWSGLDIPSAPACGLCQRPFKTDETTDGAHCGACMAQAPIHDGIAAATLYTDISRKLVLALKHGGRIALAPQLAKLIAARLPSGTADRLLIPVPLHRWRLWKRGYNQSGLIASELAKLGCGTLLIDGLQRVRATPSLGGMGRKERARALNGAIRVPPRKVAAIRGKDIVLVDDVLTSGSTSNACVKALKNAGAHTVTIACFARVIA